jgi:hypothetical protein
MWVEVGDVSDLQHGRTATHTNPCSSSLTRLVSYVPCGPGQAQSGIAASAKLAATLVRFRCRTNKRGRAVKGQFRRGRSSETDWKGMRPMTRLQASWMGAPTSGRGDPYPYRGALLRNMGPTLVMRCQGSRPYPPVTQLARTAFQAPRTAPGKVATPGAPTQRLLQSAPNRRNARPGAAPMDPHCSRTAPCTTCEILRSMKGASDDCRPAGGPDAPTRTHNCRSAVGSHTRQPEVRPGFRALHEPQRGGADSCN